MKEKIFPYVVRIGSCVMSLMLIIGYVLLLDTINLTNVGGFVVVLWIIHLCLIALFIVLLFYLIKWLKDKRKCES